MEPHAIAGLILFASIGIYAGFVALKHRYGKS